MVLSMLRGSGTTLPRLALSITPKLLVCERKRELFHLNSWNMYILFFMKEYSFLILSPFPPLLIPPPGNALDELEAHRFLEAFDEAHTVLQMRSALRKTGALGQNERPKEVPLTHFLLDKYEADWHKLVNAPQGDNSAQIAEAQDKLQAVQDAFDASTAADAEASAALVCYFFFPSS